MTENTYTYTMPHINGKFHSRTRALEMAQLAKIVMPLSAQYNKAVKAENWKLANIALGTMVQFSNIWLAGATKSTASALIDILPSVTILGGHFNKRHFDHGCEIGSQLYQQFDARYYAIQDKIWSALKVKGNSQIVTIGKTSYRLGDLVMFLALSMAFKSKKHTAIFIMKVLTSAKLEKWNGKLWAKSANTINAAYGISY